MTNDEFGGRREEWRKGATNVRTVASVRDSVDEFGRESGKLES